MAKESLVAQSARGGPKKTFTLSNENGRSDLSWLGWLPFWGMYTLVFMTHSALTTGDYLFPMWAMFCFLTVIDLCFRDESNPLPEDRKEHKDKTHWRLPLIVWVPTQLALSTFALHHYLTTEMSAGAQFGLFLLMGLVCGGGGINIAHELGHKRSKFERNLSRVLLSQVCYAHFCEEHNRGHHSNVGTRLDKASAQLGQTVFEFVPQSVWGGIMHLWHTNRPALTEAVTINVAGACFYAAMAVYWQASVLTGLSYWALQSVVAVTLLEFINYVEHYGLRRKEVSPGVFEKVTVLHSWNATQSLSNWLLFKLQRHSDHHAHALRPYHLLRTFDDSPLLPCGYSGAVLLAVCPWVWRHCMDPLVQAHASAEDVKETRAINTGKAPSGKYLRHAEWYLVTVSVLLTPVLTRLSDWRVQAMSLLCAGVFVATRLKPSLALSQRAAAATMLFVMALSALDWAFVVQLL